MLSLVLTDFLNVKQCRYRTVSSKPYCSNPSNCFRLFTLNSIRKLQKKKSVSNGNEIKKCMQRVKDTHHISTTQRYIDVNSDRLSQYRFCSRQEPSRADIRLYCGEPHVRAHFDRSNFPEHQRAPKSAICLLICGCVSPLAP